MRGRLTTEADPPMGQQRTSFGVTWRAHTKGMRIVRGPHDRATPARYVRSPPTLSLPLGCTRLQSAPVCRAACLNFSRLWRRRCHLCRHPCSFPKLRSHPFSRPTFPFPAHVAHVARSGHLRLCIASFDPPVASVGVQLKC